MGVKLKKSAGASAPEVEDGVYDARFDGITPESHPDWAGPNKFGGEDDGERWRFAFTLFMDGAVLYNEDDPEPVVVDVLTNQTMGKKSNAYALMQGILTTKELALIEAGEELDDEDLQGRMVQVLVKHNKSEWPYVEAVMPAKKARGAK